MLGHGGGMAPPSEGTETMKVTVTKMPTTEVIAAQSSSETPREVAKRLGVTYHFVKNTLVGQSWNYTRLPGSIWRRPMAEIRAAMEATRIK